MIDKLAQEINLALDNNLYFVALSTTLTLPDICGKAEYPDLKTAERYKKWYQEHIGQHYQCKKDKEDEDPFPYLNDDIVYQLRCAVLHQGNPNVAKEKTGINKFALYIESKNAFDIYLGSAGLSTNLNGETQKTIHVNVRGFCLTVIQAAKIYYKNNKEKFNFFNYEIITEEHFKNLLGCFNNSFKDKL